MYKYILYGLLVYSDIVLYNLLQDKSINRNPDIQICIDHITSDEITDTPEGFIYSMNTVYCRTRQASYLISNGDRITIEPETNADILTMTAFVLGWGFAFLLSQRNYSVLHCTALEINGYGVLISGASGSGKSTLALSLCKRGYRYMADDMAIFDTQKNVSIIPSYPLQKICKSDIQCINLDDLLYINEEREKYSYYNYDGFCNSVKELQTIFILKCTDCISVQIEEATGLDKYLRTLECLFLAEIYAEHGTPDGDRLRCLILAGKVKIYTIHRPRGMDTVNEIVDKIIELMKSS